MNEPSPVINGVSTYISFILFGLIPLLIYAIDALFSLHLDNLFVIAAVLTAAAFVVIGLLKSRVAQTRLLRAVFETLILGAIAAAVAYLLGGYLERFITG